MKWQVIFEPDTLALYGEGVVTTLTLLLSSLGVGAVLAFAAFLLVLTTNVPDGTPLQSHGLTVQHLANPSPLGFGANHNQAFAHADTPFFAVLNPDTRLHDPLLWLQMRELAAQPGVGAVTATLLNADGSVQDNQRALVTPWSLFLRRVLRRQERGADWYSAALLLMPSSAYRAVGGFDERFQSEREKPGREISFRNEAADSGLPDCFGSW